jgi:predicted secreted acid phosphatase
VIAGRALRSSQRRGCALSNMLTSIMNLLAMRGKLAAPFAWATIMVTATGLQVAQSKEPANAGDAKIAALKYHASGAYDRDLTRVGERAKNWVKRRAPRAKRPALVLDVDETSLSNWEVLKLDDFGRPIPGPCNPKDGFPCGWQAWDLLGIDPAISSTLELFRQARELKVMVFFITGRPESQRDATERNLRAAGYGGFEKLYLVPDGKHYRSAADFKAPIRAEIERAGYTIIANVGDQPSDLSGGHAEKRFLLPDPFYRVP